MAIAGSAAVHAQVRVTAAAAQPAKPDSTAATEVSAPAKGNLLAVMKTAGKYNTFLKALDAAGLTQTLDQAGPFTVFAPTDEAFAKLPGGALDRLLKPESKAKLAALMKYHLASGKVESAALARMDELKTLNGEEIDVDTTPDGKTIEMDDSRIIAPDLEATNGVVQGIDAVLEP